MSTEGWSYTFDSSGMKEERGPISDQDLVRLVDSGEIKRTTGIYHPTKTKGKWVRADQIPALRQRFEKAEEEAEERAARASRSMAIAPPKVDVLPAAPATPFQPHAAPVHQPVVVMAGPQPNAPLGAGGWFARSFAVVSGYMVAVALFMLIPIGIILFFCCGGMVFLGGAASNIEREQIEKRQQEIIQKQQELKRQMDQPLRP